MNVSLGYCEDVLKTLPVGYYLGHPVATRLDPKGDATYIELDCERITVSFSNIVNACKNAPDSYDLETVIRSLFYHEISHAIMTPSKIMDFLSNLIFRDNILRKFTVKVPGSSRKNAKLIPNQFAIPPENLAYIMSHLRDLVNIFEDERIETILCSYYMNVDFRRLVVLLNGDPKAIYDRDPMGRFFAIVRYRHGDPALVDKVQQLIKTYRGLYNDSDSYVCGNYVCNIVWLMHQVMQTMPMQSAQDKTPEQSAQSKNQSNNPQESDSDTTQQTPGQSAQDEQQPLSDEEIEQIVKMSEQFKQDFEGVSNTLIIKSLFQKRSTNPKATAVEAKVNKILMTALNKQKNLSGGSHGYAGRIDPRAVTNRDYRWFAKKNQGSAVKRFNKVRFNLFVDSSGSFCSSQAAVNALICALKKIESNNRDFSVRVAHCGAGTQLTQPDDPYVECVNNSFLDADTKSKYDSIQTPNATNVNIVVFDGRMKGKDGSTDEAYGAFNHPNCVIVSNGDNEEFINDYAPQARSIIVEDDYEKVFTDIVLSQVEKLLV
jgi:hypothetical protein